MPAGNSRLTVYHAPYPLYMASGDGCRVTDVDGVERIDCVNNMTSLVHGHRHPPTLEAVRAQIERLLTVAAPTEPEIELAEILCERLAGVDQIRFLNSGTEAVMFAIRAARAFTGKAKVAKAEGAYNGASDHMATGVLAHAPGWGEASAPTTMPDGLGISPGAVAETVTFPFNDIENTRAILEAHAEDLAAVVLCPLPSRMRFPKASRDYVAMLSETCARLGILLIFDEVMAFRLGYHGAQGEWNVKPDLTAMGKIIGGGFPAGAVGGRRDVMAVFDHMRGEPFVLHGGTFNANPVTMTAGVATLKAWTPQEVTRLNGLGERMREGFRQLLRQTNVPGLVMGDGSFVFLGLGDSGGPIQNMRDFASRSLDAELNRAFHSAMLNAGIVFAEGGTFILSTAMDDAVIDHVVTEAGRCIEDLHRQAA
jgi:glutamate-1-semialdehyde 2,1-aminomutase